MSLWGAFSPAVCFYASRETIACVISAVVAFPPRSADQQPSASVCTTAAEPRCACWFSPSLSSSCAAANTAAKDWAATPLPAMSGALPWTGSTSVKLSPALALGASPSPPTSAAAASLRMSINWGHHHVVSPRFPDQTIDHGVDDLFFYNDLMKLLRHCQTGCSKEPVGHAEHVGFVHNGGRAGPAAPCLSAPEPALRLCG